MEACPHVHESGASLAQLGTGAGIAVESTPRNPHASEIPSHLSYPERGLESALTGASGSVEPPDIEECEVSPTKQPRRETPLEGDVDRLGFLSEAAQQLLAAVPGCL